MGVESIQDFFFEAMRKGWASGAKAEAFFSPLQGSKSYQYKNTNGFYLIDYFLVAPGSKHSYGTTVIYLELKPIWVMHYGGWYEKGVMPFLRRVLMRNYSENVFMGGRGSEILEGEDHTLVYTNQVQQNGFSSFKGHEWIEATSLHSGVPAGTKLGEHHYFGGVL